MSVADKFKPVPTTPRTTSAPGAVWVGSIGLAVFLAAFSPDTMRTTATWSESLPEAAKGALLQLEALGEATGLASLRRTLDGWKAPLDDTTRLFKRPRGSDALAAPTPEPVTPTEPDVPPGERWNAAPLAGAKRRVLIVGASSIQYAVGTELQRDLDDGWAVETFRKGKVSTGLTRTDVFDWPAEIADLMEEFQPDLVIGQFGGNDGQNILDPDGTIHEVYSEGWEAEYARRLTALTEQVEGEGADLLILGMPVMRSAKFTKKIRWMNDITRRAVEAAGGDYVSTDDIAANPDGSYRPDVRFEGSSGRMRMDDGIHFTRLGGQFVAHQVARRVAQRFLMEPVLPEGSAPSATLGAIPHPLVVPSAQRGPTRALAWVPRHVPDEGLPVWYLLHGAWDDWTAWSEHAGDDLSRLAEEHGVIVVTPDGEPFGYWLDSPLVPEHRLATWFQDDLIPQVEATLPADGRRAIGGLSMGGHGALTLAMDRPGRFLAATSMSGAVDLSQTSQSDTTEALTRWLGPLDTSRPTWDAHSAHHRITAKPDALDGVALMLSVGEDDAWYAANLGLHQLLEAWEIPHVWQVQQGGHTWDVWTEALPSHAAFVADVLWPGGPPRPAPEPEPDTDGQPDDSDGEDAPAAP